MPKVGRSEAVCNIDEAHVLHATKHRQGNQLATGVWLVDQLRIGIGDGMCSLRGARVVVVFDELSRHAPNVAGAQEDEVVERVFA